MADNRYITQEHGRIALSIEFLRRYNLKPGEAVVIQETEEGLLITPKQVLVMNLLDELDEGLKAREIRLDELVESGQEIREIYDEKYAAEDDE